MSFTCNITCDIRWLIRRDLREVLSIEQEAFPFPWTEDDFIRELRQRQKIALVVEYKQRIIAYCIYHLRPTYIDVLNFAVRHDFRRQGVGSLLADRIHGKLGNRRTRVVVRVSDFNLGAQLFWSACGFHAVGVERGFFEGWDAYKFVRRRVPCHVTEAESMEHAQ